MEARKLDVFPLLEEELNPLVAIMSLDPNKMGSFSAALEESGFQSTVYSSFEDLFPILQKRRGVIVFIHWEFEGVDVKSVAQNVSQFPGTDCIVFADSDEVKTRAELASCGFQQTIQSPYTEKNFLMAVQKIKSDREKLNQQILRKIRHHERMEQQSQQASGEVSNAAEVNMAVENPNFQETSKSELFDGPEAEKSKPVHFEGNSADKGHLHNQGEREESELQIVQSEVPSSSHQHFSGEQSQPLSVEQSSSAEEEFVTAFEDTVDLESFVNESDDDAFLDAITSSEEELADHLVEQVSDESESVEVVHSDNSIEDMHSQPAEVQTDFVEKEYEENVYSVEEASIESKPNWNDIELPPLPKVDQVAVFHNSKRKKFQDAFLISRADWVLLAMGILIGLGISAYILTQVFILPLMKTMNF